jgi:hypothetical protein
VLADFNLLHLLAQRGTITGTVFAHDSNLHRNEERKNRKKYIIMRSAIGGPEARLKNRLRDCIVGRMRKSRGETFLVRRDMLIDDLRCAKSIPACASSTLKFNVLRGSHEAFSKGQRVWFCNCRGAY